MRPLSIPEHPTESYQFTLRKPIPEKSYRKFTKLLNLSPEELSTRILSALDKASGDGNGKWVKAEVLEMALYGPAFFQPERAMDACYIEVHRMNFREAMDLLPVETFSCPAFFFKGGCSWKRRQTSFYRRVG